MSYWEEKHREENKYIESNIKNGHFGNLISRITNGFSLNNKPIGSLERINNINNIMEKKISNYLIAGSWGIEGISGQKMEHDDIDLIIFNNPSFYIDDARTKEEHCCNIIPLPTDYITENAVKVKLRENLEIYVPSLNIQYCFKIIGELEEKLSKRAIHQSSILLSLYKDQDYNELKKEFIFLLRKLTPADFNVEEVTENMISAIGSYKDTEMNLKNAHRKINDSLHKKFRQMNLE